jgi:dipeptidyl aminopeptidase/acylaminoacyl peptidase
VSDEESEFTRLVRLDLAGGAPAVLTGELPWNVEEFDISPDGKTIAFITNEDGIGVLRLFDVAQNRESPRPKIPVGVPAGLEWHENGRDLGFTLDAARSARDAYSLDVTTGEVTRWTESETGGLDPQAFVDPRLVKFPSFDGLQISAFVYAPDAAKFPGPRPVLVNIHGGPEGQARPDFLGRYNYFVNELGCAVIFPNVRGSERIREALPDAGQWHEARGFRARHRRAARLDKDAAGSRCVPRLRDGWQLRRLHGPGESDPL